MAWVVAAKLDLRIHPRLRDEQSALVAANQEGQSLAREIDKLRLALREALLVKRATFLPRGVGDGEGRLDDLMAAASTLLGFLRHLGPCAAVACDDRMVNRNPTRSDREGRSVPTVCVPDILHFLQKRERITEAERWDGLRGLRVGGFALVPLEAGELEARLRHAPTRDGDPLIECAELRAIRQNLARLRQTRGGHCGAPPPVANFHHQRGRYCSLQSPPQPDPTACLGLRSRRRSKPRQAVTVNFALIGSQHLNLVATIAEVEAYPPGKGRFFIFEPALGSRAEAIPVC